MNKQVQDALKDKEFMKGIREALAEIDAGKPGIPWSKVQRELGLEAT